MILKSFEINKIDLKKNRIILIYGKNEGFKNDSLNSILKFVICFIDSRMLLILSFLSG